MVTNGDGSHLPHTALTRGRLLFCCALVSWMRVCGTRAPGHVCARVRGAHIRASQTEETDVRRFVSHLRSGGQCGRRGEPRASESLSRKQVLETEAGSESAAAASPLTRSAAWRSENGRGTGRGARATPAGSPSAPGLAGPWRSPRKRFRVCGFVARAAGQGRGARRPAWAAPSSLLGASPTRRHGGETATVQGDRIVRVLFPMKTQGRERG